MPDEPESGPPSSGGRAALVGGLSGAGLGVALSSMAWLLLGFLGLVLGVGLFVCMGAANMMSVNNSTTEELVRAFPETWWSIFGDLFTVLAMLVAGAGGLVFVGCVFAGIASGWTSTKLLEAWRTWRASDS